MCIYVYGCVCIHYLVQIQFNNHSVYALFKKKKKTQKYKPLSNVKSLFE